jgi:superfamily I DNA/RNA helicase
MQYFHMESLRDQAHALYHRGGPYRNAGMRILALIQLITNKDPNPLAGYNTTNYGESRLEKCVKYDLPGACRLVSVKDHGKVIFLFAGDHEDEEKWLNANRGTKFVVGDDKRIVPIRRVGDTLEPGERPEIQSEYSGGKLFELLSYKNYDYLVDSLPRSIARRLEGLHSFSSDDDLFDILDEIVDEKRKKFLLDVFVSLKEANIEEAERRIIFERGEFEELTEEIVLSSHKIYEIPEDDPSYAELFEHFVKTADYKKWMLFMHPAQQEIVDIDFSGSGKLLGVSGSGKTCVVVKRAVRLAKKNPDKDVLVVTLNRSLALLIDELVGSVAVEGVRDRIKVKPFFKVCQEYLYQLEPNSEKLFDDTTWKSKEHIDEVWEEYYRCELNNIDAAVMAPVHDYLIGQNINAQNYIREEFDWIRSAFSLKNRKDYLKVEREGRAIPLQAQYREMLLSGLDAWENKMLAVGITDYLGLATALSQYLDKLSSDYGSVIIDESQDFGTTEMAIIRRIAKEGENDIFVCGDVAQRVSSKFQSLKKAGIEIASTNTKKLLKNYRNSREILTAAHNILNFNWDDANSQTEDFEYLDPQLSSFSGSLPLLLKARNLEEEFAYALAYLNEHISETSNQKGCIAVCGYSLYELEMFGRHHGISVLNSETSINSDSIFISDLEQTKGFEFDAMIVINVNENVLPNPHFPQKENFRELSHLYVALTRAKTELIISCSREKSPFLKNAENDFLDDEWSKYFDSELPEVGLPESIETIRRDDEDGNPNILFLSGPKFLYTKDAVGLEADLIKKLRDLIPGTSINRQGKLVQWKNIGSAYDSCLNQASARNIFGPEGWKAFSGLCEDLEIPRLLKEVDIKSLYFAQSV